MKFQQIVRKRASQPLFSKSEIELSLRRSRATKSSVANILKRAVQRKDLIRLRNGVYCLPEKHRARIISPYEFLDKVDPYAYVTDMSALNYWGLIPEAVGIITAFSEKSIHNQKPFKTDIGTFNIIKVQRNLLLFGANNINLPHGISYRMASPLKAILDHAYLTKKIWSNREHLFRDLRIDEDAQEKINWQDLPEYRMDYNQPFIDMVCKGLNE